MLDAIRRVRACVPDASPFVVLEEARADLEEARRQLKEAGVLENKEEHVRMGNAVAHSTHAATGSYKKALPELRDTPSF
jgi:hypothetical protein